MFQEDRLRRLGDRRGDKWLSTVVPGGPLWSANTPLREDASGLRGGFEVSDGSAKEAHFETPLSVHALLLLYAASDGESVAWCAEVDAVLKAADIAVVRTRALFVDAEHRTNISREHFGFADGLSQPTPFDEAGAVTKGSAPVDKPDPVQGVPLGEFLIGYSNGHEEPAPGPVVPQERDGKPGSIDDRPGKAGLVPHREAEGFFDLGLNGSYMVVRELKQDVAAFWNSMTANAERIRAQSPAHSGHVTADWIAERAIGRDKNGHLLCPAGTLAAVNGQPDNDYLFWERDRFGHGCPLGSHVRRSNPRDALAPDDKSRPSLLKAANNHRILRRGRKYGPPIADMTQDDGVDRGLLFMCLNTDIARQFEFVQQTWLLNTTFATLYQEQDPLIGTPGPMTIRETPLRRIVHVDTYVQMVGGDYFFLPSLPALRYLSLL
jgi:Dyp-type peroxidase family